MTPSKPAVTELRERLRRRAETYNTGSAVDPTAMGTLGYYSAHDAALDRDLLDALGLLQAENARLVEELKEHRSDLSYVIGWNAGFEHAFKEDLKFPTMLRKMWSGGEVQRWLDEQFAARRALATGKRT